MGETAVGSNRELVSHVLVGGESPGVAPGIYWFFGAGIGISVIVMATIGLLHRSLDKRSGGILRLSRPLVISTRYMMGILMALLPLAHRKLGPTTFLALYVAITAFLIIEETFSRLERIQREDWDL
jgi:hypothetical protein